MRWSAVTDTGLVRPNNEDNHRVNEALGLFAVADGMGGHQAGEVASRLALTVLEEQFQELVQQGEETGNALLYAVEAANRQVFEESCRSNRCNGMGTTLSACLIAEEGLILAHVGDSRVYLVRAGEIFQLTEDHSVVQELLNEGRITAEEVPGHPYRNVLSRALGTGEQLEIDLLRVPLQAGDRVLLCTDGLTNMVSDAAIQAVVAGYGDPDQAVRELVRLALEQGGSDNITLILVVL
ncbi:Stp1/IreP family PP2C-type Ser/Thr phosphatase [Candidatus Desulforudis audaxviator]|uniref:Protein phosphatase 2C domain protein n=1 Tax=Desulforudis audaxviator (strain MP104C) TaxID=477974 RepID=B1I500_DESAP|nr:Stp1/IreP family PP2C-type Ser/Thr phosphatase [Candidatus Desulforudis audaxviator]ACA60091.1 protein phosphatase 2C domain protein [Candidatus Desulforudis audaxviator MP104C]AZK60127.1 Protein serine/threonine phosphatase PrpC, regulation of stationary phase [Candidatus Desulforudis audaxviator]